MSCQLLQVVIVLVVVTVKVWETRRVFQALWKGGGWAAVASFPQCVSFTVVDWGELCGLHELDRRSRGV
jgi:hypothetical protein